MYCKSRSTPYCWQVIRGVFGAAQCFRHSSHCCARPMLKPLKCPSDHVFLKQTHLGFFSFDSFLLVTRLQGKVVRFLLLSWNDTRYFHSIWMYGVVCNQDIDMPSLPYRNMNSLRLQFTISCSAVKIELGHAVASLALLIQSY